MASNLNPIKQYVNLRSCISFWLYNFPYLKVALAPNLKASIRRPCLKTWSCNHAKFESQCKETLSDLKWYVLVNSAYRQEGQFCQRCKRRNHHFFFYSYSPLDGMPGHAGLSPQHHPTPFPNLTAICHLSLTDFHLPFLTFLPLNRRIDFDSKEK